MEGAVTSVLGPLVVETARPLCDSIYSKIRNTFKFQSNLNALKQKMEILIERRKNIEEELETAEKEGKLPTQLLKEWLRDAERIELEVNSMQENMTGNGGSHCGCCFNCCLHYRLSQKVAEKLEEVESLMKVCSVTDDMVTIAYRVKKVEYIPGPSIKSQTTASENLSRVMDLLNDDGVRSILIWGMGGVGKTTLVRNLNNKLEGNSSKQPFDIVIWATVSKELDLKKVQTQIARRLKLELNSEESEENRGIQLHQRLGMEKKFLLILDDVWKKIDLYTLGVPQQEGSKIILTSRSVDVCRGMKIDEQVKVGILNADEAWELFTDNAGKEASLEHIKPFAEAIARECKGNPLAITIMGRAMRGREKIELWMDALKKLQQSEPYTGEIEEEVYYPLKCSYDFLKGKNTQPCFLYCSLFPEDFSIKESELVQYWLADGLIDEQPIYEDSLNRGIAIIENLKGCCLLEDGMDKGTVKMHDLVRDVAIWIASSLEEGCKSLVRSGIGWSQISEDELLKPWKRISFMNNKIATLPDCVIQCPETSTLLLQGNHPLQRVPERFLLGFEALRVLNMSGTCIQSLPLSLTQLGELRTLVLQYCDYLEELPPLGGLRKLQVLDLGSSGIREFPKGMEELSNLRQLNLSFTHHLKNIQAGVVSRLSGLEVLDMTKSAYKWGVKGEVEEGQTMFEELEHLRRLTVVHIWLGSMPHLGSKDPIWIERLIRFLIIVSPDAVKGWLTSEYGERKVILSHLDLSEQRIGWLLINANNLVLKSCTDLGWMFEYLVTNSGGFAGLKSLTIDECHSFGPFKGCAARHDLLPNLEKFRLNRLHNLECVLPLVAPLGLRFSSLRKIEVSSCPKLTYLIPHDLIPNLINLQEIRVHFCNNLNELFQYSSGQTVARDAVVPKLRVLELEGLPKLRTICRQTESWQSLERVRVIECNLLKKLPLTSRNANTIKEIIGEEQWWSELEWDDDDTKLSLQPFFELYITMDLEFFFSNPLI